MKPRKSGLGLEGVVPVVARGTQALNGGMKGDHGLSHTFAGLVGVKTAVDPGAASDQGSKPGGVGPGAGAGEAPVIGIKCQGTDGVNG